MKTKRHFVFLTFVFSVVCAFGSYINGDWLELIAWLTASVASIDHFFTLKHFE
jgi:hypothetical protein